MSATRWAAMGPHGPGGINMLRITIAAAGIAIVLPALVASCASGGGPQNQDNPGSIGGFAFTILWPEASAELVPSASQSVKIVVRDASTGESQGGLVLTRDDPTGRIERLPHGLECQIVAIAYPNADATGTAQASGAVTETVPNGGYRQVTLTMSSRIASAEITPSTASVYIGETRALSATARDTAGSVVLVSGTWQWASSDADLATVGVASGVLQGVSPGSVSITATEAESGMSARLDLTVTTRPVTGFTFDHQVGSDGTGLFNGTLGIAVDAAGNVYTCEADLGRIRQWASTGTELQDWGYGTGLVGPRHCAVDNGGNTWVADRDNHRLVEIDASGSVTGSFGTLGTDPGELYQPSGVAISGTGNVYVANTGNNRIEVFDLTGAYQSNFTGAATAGGPLSQPTGIAVDTAGIVYVADSGNDRVEAFDASGALLYTWGVSGSGNSEFVSPEGIAIGADGRVYVADTGNNRIQCFSDRGVFIRKWGTLGSADGQLDRPTGVASDASTNIYVADSDNHRVQVFNSTGSFLRKWGSGGGNGGFFKPESAVVDGTGQVYVADTRNNRVQLFDTDGGFVGSWGTSGAANGQFDRTGGVALDNSNNVLVTDRGNDRVQRFSAAGSFQAAWGTPGSGDGSFDQPHGIAVDSVDRVYVADSANNRVQVLDPDGFYIRKWGAPGAGDGQFNNPTAVAVAPWGQVLVTDTGNGRVQVFEPGGAFVRSWTLPSGTPAPAGIAVDGTGTVYVADPPSDAVYAYDALGTLLATLDWTTDGRHDPLGVAVNAGGALLYVTGDYGNVRAYTVNR